MTYSALVDCDSLIEVELVVVKSVRKTRPMKARITIIKIAAIKEMPLWLNMIIKTPKSSSDVCESSLEGSHLH